MKLIAEIGQSHEGSLGIAHSYIDALASTGVNVVKFQTHIAHAESSLSEGFRVNFSYEDATRYDYWKRMEFTTEQWLGLKKHCEDLGLEFVSSPFSMEAVDLLEEIGVNKYKIGSGEILNLLMLRKIASTGKDIWLSTGMSSYDEIDDTLRFLSAFDNKLALFQCTTEYPTHPANWGLNVMAEFKKRYRMPVGFSDHSGDIYAGLAAAALEADFLEFHVVFDKEMFGPDSKASLSLNQIKQLVHGVNQIKKAQQNPVDKNNTQKYELNKTLFGKTLAARDFIPKGVPIELCHLETKKPGGMGISAKFFEKVLGITAKVDIQKGDFIQWEDLEIND